MKLCLIGHSVKYELEKLIRIFLPFEKIEFCEEPYYLDAAVTELKTAKEKTVLSAALYVENGKYSCEKELSNSAADYENECERLLAAALFECFKSASGYTPEWGILT